MMKRINATLLLAFFIAGLITLLSGCKEINPLVLPTHSKAIGDTTYIENPIQSPMPKYALIEEVTGVSCANCPAGHAIVDGIISSQHAIAVAYHVGAPLFNQDAAIVLNPLQVMTSPDAQAIVGNNGPFVYPAAGPVAMIDRVVFNNGNSYGPTLSQNGIWNYDAGWGGDVTSETTAPNNNAPVNINITANYSGGKIIITVGLHYTTTQTDSDKITEDSIVTAQLLADQSVDTFYMHNHIMRAAVSAPLGDVVNSPGLPAAGRVVITTYQYPSISSTSSIPAIWNIAHMHVVAFVHRYQNGNYNVLQAATSSITH